MLDASQPEVVDWLRARSGAATRDRGFDVIRVTDLQASVESGWHLDARESPMTALRGGLSACRAGSRNTPIIAARGPLLGLLDVVDIVETWAGPVTRAASLLQCCGPSWPRPGLDASAGPTVIADPAQTLDEARAAGTIAALSGGSLLLDGPWTKELTINEKTFFERVCLRATRQPSPSILLRSAARFFGARLNSHWGEWLLVVALNPSAVPSASHYRSGLSL